MSDKLFTPAAILSLLAQIDELKSYDVGITETIDGDLQLQIGDSIYLLEPDVDNEVVVDDKIIDQVEDINYDAYQDLEASGDVGVSDEIPIESGIIKELAKSLLLGGMIRLSGKLLK